MNMEVREKTDDSIIAAVDTRSASASDVELDAIKEERLLRKLDLHLVPGLALVFLLSYLDRANVANARLEGLAVDLHISTFDLIEV